jgi:hypothetical protein
MTNASLEGCELPTWATDTPSYVNAVLDGQGIFYKLKLLGPDV